MDLCLKFVTHIDAITQKTAAVSWMIRASFFSRDQVVLKLVFCTYIRSILEHSSQVWNPHHKYLIDRIEKNPKEIHQINTFCCSYMERLKLLELMTLEKRHLLADLTFCFKLLSDFTDSPLWHILLIQDCPGARGHDFKLRCNTFSTHIAKYSFRNRIIKPWNALPNEIVNSNTVSRFNASIHDFDLL